MKIVLIGPQGSGKGTQAKLIASKLGIPHISTGDLFRENIAKETELGRKVKEIMNAGNLVPDEIVVGMLKARISEPDAAKGFVLDGYPRNLKQAKVLESLTCLDKAILIDVSDEVSIQRISSRRYCPGCNEIYGVNRVPEALEQCNNCKEKLQQRDDDKPEVVKKRLENYHKFTEPMLDFYQKKGILTRINGDQTVEEVFRDIEKILK